MSKRVHDKIKIKHNNIYNLTTAVQFNYLMESTIGSCRYSKSNDTLNFIAYLEDQNKFVLYSLKAEKHHCVCSTIFSLKKETLKKYYEDESFKLFNNKYKNKIENFLY